MFFANHIWLDYYQYFSAILIILITIIASIKYYKKKAIIVVNHEGITTKIVEDTESCIKVLNELRALNPCILGLDCEWVGKNKVSLLQLGHCKLIVLIRLNKMKTIPVELIGLMNNNYIIKTGVGIYNDAAKLRYDYNIDINGCIDINDILPLITSFEQLVNDYYGDKPYQFNQEMYGLNRLSKILLKHPMKYKDKKISISNWEINKLSQKQIHYAADDAIIGYNLFKKCMELETIEHDIENYLSFCFGRMDIHHYHKLSEDDNFSKKIKVKRVNLSSLGLSQQTEIERKREERRTNHERKHRTHFFDNCRLLKPDGTLLFGCSQKSMQWYLKKNLAEIVDEHTAKLLFEPNIKNEESLEYYKGKRVNQCFICGRCGALCQFDVVPKQYRGQMDIKYRNKGWRLHDYIPLCTMCHPQALKSQTILIESLCKKYSDIPYYKVKKGDQEHKKLCNAQRAAKALKKQREKNVDIPIKRQIELFETLCMYFQLKYEIIYNENEENKNDDGWDKWIKIEHVENLSTTQIINQCIEKLEVKIEENSNKSQWELHAKAMLEIFSENQPQFIELWRKHFVETMKPRHLPDSWSVSTSNMLDQIDVTQ